MRTIPLGDSGLRVSALCYGVAGFGTGVRGAAFDNAVSRARLDRVLDLAARKGCTPNQLALAWLLNQPFPVVPILGTNDPAHLADALGAPGVALTVAEVGWVEG